MDGTFKSRASPRYHVFIEVDVWDLASNNQLNGRATDISLFGCGIVNIPQLLPPQTKVRVRFRQSGEEVMAVGRVVYAKPAVGMGVVFTLIDSEHERILDGWIATLAAEAASRQ